MNTWRMKLYSHLSYLYGRSPVRVTWENEIVYGIKIRKESFQIIERMKS